MDSVTIKESRRALRQIQEHLYQAHHSLGVRQESVGLVDVLYHPTSTLANLNYVTPRRNTAWVSGEMIEQGLDIMRQLKRIPRVHYIEGLFLPRFSRSLHDVGLKAEWERPLMLYLKGGFNDRPPPPLYPGRLPKDMSIEPVTDERGAQAWRYVWQNLAYDLMTLGVEPLFAGRDLSALKQGCLIDILMQQGGSLVGVARLSIQGETAHLVAMAILKAARKPALLRRLQMFAVRVALSQGCTIIYTSGETDAERQVARGLGFLDFGSIICYTAAASTETQELQNDRILGQPVFALR